MKSYYSFQCEHFARDAVLFWIRASHDRIMYWTQLFGRGSALMLLASVCCSSVFLDLGASCFLSPKLPLVHLEKWCVLKRGWRRSISGSQAEGQKIEQTRRHQLGQVVSSNVLKVRLPLHKPLLAHHTADTDMDLFMLCGLHHLHFSITSHKRHTSEMRICIPGTRLKTVTRSLKLTCFHTSVQFASVHNWPRERRCSLTLLGGGKKHTKM